VCRTHCASRRSLRDDPNYDALIAALYPDIDKYEEEVMSYVYKPYYQLVVCCLASFSFHYRNLLSVSRRGFRIKR
jgi:hypothetical protein